jgi:hypothetical protein
MPKQARKLAQFSLSDRTIHFISDGEVISRT